MYVIFKIFIMFKHLRNNSRSWVSYVGPEEGVKASVLALVLFSAFLLFNLTVILNCCICFRKI